MTNQDRKMLLTGGSGAIGRAIATGFAASGAEVAATSRSGAVSEAEHSLAMELEQPTSIVEAVAQAERLLGGIDTLVVNAVRWPSGSPERFEALEPTEWRSVLRANVEGNFHLVRAALPALRSSHAGRIVIISSGVAEEGHPPAAHYVAAKAALHGLCRALAWDAGRDGVLVNAIAAGIHADSSGS
jgi:3-oxoacyl-[acyl-carrier protein] reductase